MHIYIYIQIRCYIPGSISLINFEIYTYRYIVPTVSTAVRLVFINFLCRSRAATFIIRRPRGLHFLSRHNMGTPIEGP